MAGAPYDQKNEADYNDMSDRINAALFEIERDRRIPVTQKELAKRAECSRGTLRNRRWPITRLRAIKEQRKTEGGSKPKQLSLSDRADIDVHIEDKKKLLQQLNSNRDELARWVDKCKELETKNKKLARAKTVLEKAKASLETHVTELLREVANLNEQLNRKQAKQVVVPLKRSARPSSNQEQPISKREKKNRR